MIQWLAPANTGQIHDKIRAQYKASVGLWLIVLSCHMSLKYILNTKQIPHKCNTNVSVANTNKTQIQNQSTDTKQVMGISDTVSAWLVLANTSQRCFGTSTVSSCTVFVEHGGTRGRCAAMCAMRFVFNRLAKCVTSSWNSRGANMCMNWILIEICRGRWICAGNHDAQMANFYFSFHLWFFGMCPYMKAYMLLLVCYQTDDEEIVLL